MLRTLAVRIAASLLALVAAFLPASAPAQVAPLPTPNLQLGGPGGGVKAIATLVDGGLLIGGNFAAVNGIPRAGIARLNADGSLDTGWTSPFTYGDVKAIVVFGAYAYVGGVFDSVGGPAYAGLVRIDAARGTITTDWTAGVAGSVNALAIDGTDLIVGGSFQNIGGVARRSLAKVSLSTGAVSAWTNDVQGAVNALGIDGDNLYLAGVFNTIAGQTRPSGIYRVSRSVSTSLDTSWGAEAWSVRDLAVFGAYAYFAGDFGSVGTISRQYLARLATSSAATVDPGWTPTPNAPVMKLFVDAGGAVITGRFFLVNGVLRRALAEIDLTTGAVTSWDPSTIGGYEGSAIAQSSGVVFTGFLDAGLLSNGATKVLRATRNASADDTFRVFAGSDRGVVTSIALASDGRSYVGGYIEGVNGLPIANLMRLNADGTLDPGWHPDPNGPVQSLAFGGSDLLAGGSFDRIGGLARNYVAKISTAAIAVVDSWNPNPNGMVSNVAVDGEDVYIAGDFNTVSGLPRYATAKLTLSGSGAAVASWNANWTGPMTIRALAAAGGSVYVGGSFLASSAGQDNLVKLFGTTGARDTAFTTVPNSSVGQLAFLGPQLLIGGGFHSIGAIPQRSLAKVDASTGALDEAWMPVLTDSLTHFTLQNGVAYVPIFFVNGTPSTGDNAAISTTSGRRDVSWSTEFFSSLTAASRPGQIWFGLDGSSVDRNGVAAFPEALCASEANGSFCGTGRTCQASVCTTDIAATTTSLSVSPNHAVFGSSITFTATVASAAGVPSGRVYFFGARGFMFASAILDNGIATISESAYAEHTHVVAVFEGSAAFAPSRSAAVTPTVVVETRRYDFNSDNRPDIVFRSSTSGATYVWRMNGTMLASDQYVTTIDPSWRLIGHGDFNGDGKNDIVWRNDATGTAYVWYLNDGAFVSDAFLFSVDPVWKIEAVADFNNDGKPDFLFRHATSGVGFIWYFNNSTPIGDQYLYSIDNAWIVENVGDFNGDGYVDFFFRNLNSGLGFVWYWNGTSLGASNFLFSIDPVWQVVEIVDWNYDGKVDLLFRNDSTGVTFVWYTDGNSLQGSDFLFQVDPSWKIMPYR